jgi:carbon monoxide dehydrogenase subunit G
MIVKNSDFPVAANPKAVYAAVADPRNFQALWKHAKELELEDPFRYTVKLKFLPFVSFTYRIQVRYSFSSVIHEGTSLDGRAHLKLEVGFVPHKVRGLTRVISTVSYVGPLEVLAGPVISGLTSHLSKVLPLLVRDSVLLA